MRHRSSAFVGCILSIFWLFLATLPQGKAADNKDQVLFNFEGKSAAKDWTPVKLTEVEEEQPPPTIEIVPTPKEPANHGQAGKCLKITFVGGEWPAVGTTTIPVQGNWKPFQTLKAEVAVDRPS